MRRLDSLLFLALLLSLFLPAAPLPAQETPPPGEDVFAEKDPLEGRVMGERVEITLTNGSLFRGELRALFKDRIKMDMSFESNTDGMMTFERKKIRRCRLLPALSAEERSRIAAAREAAKSGSSESASESTESGTTGGAGENPDEGKKKEPTAEEKRKAELQALLAEYPPEAWPESRYAEILAKDPSQREPEEQRLVDKYSDWLEAKKMKAVDERSHLLERFPPGAEWNEQKFESLQSKLAVFGVPCTADEQAFVDNFADWQAAKVEKEEAAKKEAEKKAEEEKKKAPEGEDKSKTEEGAPTGEGAKTQEGSKTEEGSKTGEAP